jgi:hypothetical protein
LFWEDLLQFLGLLAGITGIIGWSMSLLPQLAWLNWIFMPVAVTGLVFCIVGMSISFHHRGMGIAGIIICVVGILLNVLHLTGIGTI